jgi:hypothetical protein
MAENTNEVDFAPILANVPKSGILRIDSTISNLRAQRDAANNSAVSLAAELDVFKSATDYYYQMSLGLQAQVVLTKQEYDSAVAENAHLSSLVEQHENMLAKYLEAMQGVLDATAGCTNFKDLTKAIEKLGLSELLAQGDKLHDIETPAEQESGKTDDAGGGFYS